MEQKSEKLLPKQLGVNDFHLQVLTEKHHTSCICKSYRRQGGKRNEIVRYDT